MSTIEQIISYLITIVRAGAGLRIIFCFIKMGTSEEEYAMYKKRLRNVLIFLILSESVWQIKDIVMNYYT